MTEFVDLAKQRRLRDLEELIARAQSNRGGLPTVDSTIYGNIEFTPYLASDDSGEVMSLHFLICETSTGKSRAVGLIILSPEQWEAIRDSGDQLMKHLKTAGALSEDKAASEP